MFPPCTVVQRAHRECAMHARALPRHTPMHAPTHPPAPPPRAKDAFLRAYDDKLAALNQQAQVDYGQVRARPWPQLWSWPCAAYTYICGVQCSRACAACKAAPLGWEQLLLAPLPCPPRFSSLAPAACMASVHMPPPPLPPPPRASSSQPSAAQCPPAPPWALERPPRCVHATLRACTKAHARTRVRANIC